VKASNSCARTLIFGSFSFIVFLSKFFFCSFSLFWLSVLLSFLDLIFYRPSFPPSFHPCFVPIFLAHVVSSLAYPNLLGTKKLGCCCCETCMPRWIYGHIRRDHVQNNDIYERLGVAPVLEMFVQHHLRWFRHI
jgi:hypothetical protein